MSPKPRHRARSKVQGRRPAAQPRTAEPAVAAPLEQAAPRRVQPPAARGTGIGKAPLRLDYVKGDLKRIAVTAGAIVVGIVVLAIVLPRLVL